jgi:hypothetical protein
VVIEPLFHVAVVVQPVIASFVVDGTVVGPTGVGCVLMANIVIDVLVKLHMFPLMVIAIAPF